MTSILSLRWPVLLAAILLTFGAVMPLHAAPASITTLLEDAYATLGRARHDYKGHRIQAMKQIEAAFNDSGWKVRGTGKIHKPQGTSDSQLRSARSLLQQARGGRSRTAANHVDHAITQINDALAAK